MDPDISIWRKTGHFYFALTFPCFAGSVKRYVLCVNCLRVFSRKCDSGD